MNLDDSYEVVEETVTVETVTNHVVEKNTNVNTTITIDVTKTQEITQIEPLPQVVHVSPVEKKVDVSKPVEDKPADKKVTEPVKISQEKPVPEKTPVVVPVQNNNTTTTTATNTKTVEKDVSKKPFKGLIIVEYEEEDLVDITITKTIVVEISQRVNIKTEIEISEKGGYVIGAQETKTDGGKVTGNDIKTVTQGTKDLDNNTKTVTQETTVTKTTEKVVDVNVKEVKTGIIAPVVQKETDVKKNISDNQPKQGEDSKVPAKQENPVKDTKTPVALTKIPEEKTVPAKQQSQGREAKPPVIQKNKNGDNKLKPKASQDEYEEVEVVETTVVEKQVTKTLTVIKEGLKVETIRTNKRDDDERSIVSQKSSRSRILINDVDKNLFSNRSLNSKGSKGSKSSNGSDNSNKAISTSGFRNTAVVASAVAALIVLASVGGFSLNPAIAVPGGAGPVMYNSGPAPAPAPGSGSLPANSNTPTTGGSSPDGLSKTGGTDTVPSNAKPDTPSNLNAPKDIANTNTPSDEAQVETDNGVDSVNTENGSMPNLDKTNNASSSSGDGSYSSNNSGNSTDGANNPNSGSDGASPDNSGSNGSYDNQTSPESNSPSDSNGPTDNQTSPDNNGPTDNQTSPDNNGPTDNQTSPDNNGSSDGQTSPDNNGSSDGQNTTDNTGPPDTQTTPANANPSDNQGIQDNNNPDIGSGNDQNTPDNTGGADNQGIPDKTDAGDGPGQGDQTDGGNQPSSENPNPDDAGTPDANDSGDQLGNFMPGFRMGGSKSNPVRRSGPASEEDDGTEGDQSSDNKPKHLTAIIMNSWDMLDNNNNPSDNPVTLDTSDNQIPSDHQSINPPLVYYNPVSVNNAISDSPDNIPNNYDYRQIPPLNPGGTQQPNGGQGELSNPNGDDFQPTDYTQQPNDGHGEPSISGENDSQPLDNTQQPQYSNFDGKTSPYANEPFENTPTDVKESNSALLDSLSPSPEIIGALNDIANSMPDADDEPIEKPEGYDQLPDKLPNEVNFLEFVYPINNVFQGDIENPINPITTDEQQQPLDDGSDGQNPQPPTPNDTKGPKNDESSNDIDIPEYINSTKEPQEKPVKEPSKEPEMVDSSDEAQPEENNLKPVIPPFEVDSQTVVDPVNQNPQSIPEQSPATLKTPELDLSSIDDLEKKVNDVIMMTDILDKNVRESIADPLKDAKTPIKTTNTHTPQSDVDEAIHPIIVQSETPSVFADDQISIPVLTDTQKPAPVLDAQPILQPIKESQPEPTIQQINVPPTDQQSPVVFVNSNTQPNPQPQLSGSILLIQPLQNTNPSNNAVLNNPLQINPIANDAPLRTPVDTKPEEPKLQINNTFINPNIYLHAPNNSLPTQVHHIIHEHHIITPQKVIVPHHVIIPHHVYVQTGDYSEDFQPQDAIVVEEPKKLANFEITLRNKKNVKTQRPSAYHVYDNEVHHEITKPNLTQRYSNLFNTFGPRTPFNVAVHKSPVEVNPIKYSFTSAVTHRTQFEPRVQPVHKKVYEFSYDFNNKNTTMRNYQPPVAVAVAEHRVPVTCVNLPVTHVIDNQPVKTSSLNIYHNTTNYYNKNPTVVQQEPTPVVVGQTTQPTMVLATPVQATVFAVTPVNAVIVQGVAPVAVNGDSVHSVQIGTSATVVTDQKASMPVNVVILGQNSSPAPLDSSNDVAPVAAPTTEQPNSATIIPPEDHTLEAIANFINPGDVAEEIITGKKPITSTTTVNKAFNKDKATDVEVGNVALSTTIKGANLDVVRNQNKIMSYQPQGDKSPTTNTTLAVETNGKGEFRGDGSISTFENNDKANTQISYDDKRLTMAKEAKENTNAILVDSKNNKEVLVSIVGDSKNNLKYNQTDLSQSDSKSQVMKGRVNDKKFQHEINSSGTLDYDQEKVQKTKEDSFKIMEVDQNTSRGKEGAVKETLVHDKDNLHATSQVRLVNLKNEGQTEQYDAQTADQTLKIEKDKRTEATTIAGVASLKTPSAHSYVESSKGNQTVVHPKGTDHVALESSVHKLEHPKGSTMTKVSSTQGVSIEGNNTKGFADKEVHSVVKEDGVTHSKKIVRKVTIGGDENGKQHTSEHVEVHEIHRSLI